MIRGRPRLSVERLETFPPKTGIGARPAAFILLCDKGVAGSTGKAMLRIHFTMCGGLVSNGLHWPFAWAVAGVPNEGAVLGNIFALGIRERLHSAAREFANGSPNQPRALQ